jgi:hypothetical protein
MMGNIQIVEYVRKLGQDLDNKYLNEWSKYSILSLRDLICRQICNDSIFAMKATYYYCKSSNGQNMMPTIDFITPLIERVKIKE